MQKFCPLCMKNGIRNQMKLFQLNMEEAVWSCENINCIWPFGYEDPTFVQRSALTCNWEEERDLNTECTSMLKELSLYTPPMTPRGETLECSLNSTIEDKLSELSSNSDSTSSKKEITDYNNQSFELANNKFIKERDINMNADKLVPKIINNEKVSICISKIQEDKHFGNERIQEHLNATSTIDISEEYSVLFANTEYNEFSTQTHKKESSRSNNIQTSEVMNCLDLNKINKWRVTTNTEDKVDITNNSNITNDSTLDTINTSDINIDNIIDDILTSTGEIKENMGDDWLDLIVI